MNTAEVLERAADIMQERGKVDDWSAYDSAGRVCTICAINIAAGGVAIAHGNDVPERLDAIDAMKRFIGGFISGWTADNDIITVTSGMRAVAATLRAQQARQMPVPVEAECVS